MDTTIAAWLRELGARAFNLGLTSEAYINKNEFTLDNNARWEVFQGWLDERNNAVNRFCATFN